MWIDDGSGAMLAPSPLKPPTPLKPRQAPGGGSGGGTGGGEPDSPFAGAREHLEARLAALRGGGGPGGAAGSGSVFSATSYAAFVETMSPGKPGAGVGGLAGAVRVKYPAVVAAGGGSMGVSGGGGGGARGSRTGGGERLDMDHDAVFSKPVKLESFMLGEADTPAATGRKAASSKRSSGRVVEDELDV